MGGRSSKQKGSRRERQVVEKFLGEGIQAQRVPLSGAAAGFKGDVWAELAGERLVVEVKARANGEGFATLERWIEGAQALVLWRDRTEPMVLMNWSEWVKRVKR